MANKVELKLQITQITRQLLDITESLGDTRYRSANDIAVGFIWEGLQRHLGFKDAQEIALSIDQARNRRKTLESTIEEALKGQLDE